MRPLLANERPWNKLHGEGTCILTYIAMDTATTRLNPRQYIYKPLGIFLEFFVLLDFWHFSRKGGWVWAKSKILEEISSPWVWTFACLKIGQRCPNIKWRGGSRRHGQCPNLRRFSSVGASLLLKQIFCRCSFFQSWVLACCEEWTKHRASNPTPPCHIWASLAPWVRAPSENKECVGWSLKTNK